MSRDVTRTIRGRCNGGETLRYRSPTSSEPGQHRGAALQHSSTGAPNLGAGHFRFYQVRRPAIFHYFSEAEPTAPPNISRLFIRCGSTPADFAPPMWTRKKPFPAISNRRGGWSTEKLISAVLWLATDRRSHSTKSPTMIFALSVREEAGGEGGGGMLL